MKASKFLDARRIVPAETVSASKKLDRAAAAALVKAATTVIVAKGKKVDVFTPAGKPVPAAVEAMLGPTGNLRAPTLRIGSTVLVGFDDATYRDVLG